MSVIAISGQAYTFDVSVISQADTNIFQVNPTIAAGDFQRSINGAAFGNLDNLPTVTPAAGRKIQIVLSAAETTSAADGGRIYIVGNDQAGSEWQDIGIEVRVRDADLSVLTAADVWTYATRTLTSFGTLVADVAAAVWSYTTRTLTQSAASIIAAVDGNALSLYRATYWTFSITGLGSLADVDKLYFTIKRKGSTPSPQRIPDRDALVQIEEGDGLIYIDGREAQTAANGTLTIDDAVAGNITVTLEAVESAKLSPEVLLSYDVKRVAASDGRQYLMTQNFFNILDVTTEALT